MKRFLAILAIASGISGRAMAQQEAMYSQYMFNTLAINPAYAGSRNLLSATALHRNQWVGIDGAPRTTTFTIDAPVKDKIGLGLQVFNDRVGINNTTGAFASYAYRIKMGGNCLSLGLQAGASQYRANFSSIPLNTGGSGDIAFRDNINQLLINFGTGIYYNSERFYLGLSSPQLLSNKLGDFTAQGDNVFSKQQLHLFLASGYVFPLGESFNFKPSVLLKGVRGSPLAADLNATLWIRDVLAFGVQYRTGADISALVEIQANPQIRIGYAYDRSVTQLVKFNSGSHEIMLRYEFGFEKNKTLSPRYF